MGGSKALERQALKIIKDVGGMDSYKKKLVIQKTVPVYQINRHHCLRKTGEAERRPAYNATDWNYIRFDCGAMSYELYNDSVKLF